MLAAGQQVRQIKAMRMSKEAGRGWKKGGHPEKTSVASQEKPPGMESLNAE